MKSLTERDIILIVDDALDTLEMLQRNLSLQNYRVFTAINVDKAIEILDTVHVDLVVTDYKMPRRSGLDLVKYVAENFRNTGIIMVTGYASINGAVNAVKQGAGEYLSKPFTDEELYSAVQRVLDKLQNHRAMHKKPQEQFTQYGLIGHSKVMNEVFNDIQKASAIPATVLIAGESGTGKELVARSIHYGGARVSSPFIPVNCAGIPENLFESELFGYVKGAFTGAMESRIGFFQAADGGSIFLDEISEASMPIQAKLLRVLQDKEICMVGSRKQQKLDVRVLTATNKNLFDLVEKGLFREDLFYRLNVININMPPLRDRGDDILLLISHFVQKLAEELGKPVPHFSDKALNVLKNYCWPGNIRELENLIQRLLVMVEGDTINVPDLPSFMRFSIPREKNVKRSLKEVESEHILNVLQSVNGNKNQAAGILEIDRKTLRSKLAKINNC